MTDFETLSRLFPDVTGWESTADDLWRGVVAHPPNCWRYVLLRGDRYASVEATFEIVRDGIGVEEYITRKLDIQIRHESAGDEQ